MGLERVFPTVVHMLSEAAEQAPGREAVVFQDERLTYRDYARAAACLAHELIDLGARGERVAFVLPNGIDICIAYFGTHAAGAQAVPLNPLYTGRELTEILHDAEARVIFYGDEVAKTVEPVAEKLGIPHRIIVGPGHRRLTDLKGERGLDGRLPLPEPDSLATLQFTGGTTGRSKGVDLSHRAIAVNISQKEALVPSRLGRERMLCVMPLFHVYASHVCLHSMAYAHSTMVILPRYHPEETCQALDEERITIFGGSPTIFTGLLGFGGFQETRLADLAFSYSGSSALPESVLAEWETRTGTPIIEGYGQSEAGPVVSFNPLDGTRKAGSVGIAVPETEVELVDLEAGTDALPAGEKGEIRVRGPQIMDGYRGLPDETARTLRDGWLYTGDIGEFDSDGYLYIRDRKKEMVIVSGYNVFPREVENVLYEHPAVAEAAVIGVADTYRGEILKAVVALKPGHEADAGALEAHCRGNLAKYKVPARFDILDALPKTAVGKIDKKALMP